MKALVSFSLAALVLITSTFVPVTAEARTVQQAHIGPALTAGQRTLPVPDTVPVKPTPRLPVGARDLEFSGWWHDAGELWLHTSNYGFVGDWGTAPTEPSAEWPAASGFEHLFCAGLWVGARVGPDTLVSSAVYGVEFRAPDDDPVYTIYVSSAGAPGGEPGFDDDSDGLVDEDRLDGIDNDLDAAIDEDYAAASDEMFACVYFDTTELDQVPPEDPHTPIGLEVYETSFAWGHDRFDDFVRIRYEITNIGDDVLEEVYLGLMADPDVGDGADASNNYLDDRVAYVAKEIPEAPTHERFPMRMAYCWDEPGGDDGDWDGYIGFLVLDHPTDPDGIVAPPAVGPLVYRSWFAGAEDPRDDAERYRYMSDPVVSPPASVPNDWRFLFSVGPFDHLAPGETTFLEIAVVCGHGIRGLVENASALSCRLEDASTLPKLEEHAVPGNRDALDVHRLALAPPAPNPAATSTRIAFTLPGPGPVRLSVLSPGGRLVATLVDGERGAGQHVAVWDGRTDSGERASSGVYVVRLSANGREAFRKLVLMR